MVKIWNFISIFKKATCTKLLFSLDQKRCSLREAFGAEAEQSGVPPSHMRASLITQVVKNLPTMGETQV